MATSKAASPTAKVVVGVFVARAFVAIRRAISVDSQIAQKLALLEQRLEVAREPMPYRGSI